MRQAYNPYLPSYEYIPDGEPHVFGDRIYIYGSHDRFNAANYCLNDYVCYSADIRDLTNWRYEGVILRKEQDPRNQNIPTNMPPAARGRAALETIHEGELNSPGIMPFYAPDVTRGSDGRYYLYYGLGESWEIGVAVCDEPAGQYEFYGFVQHPDGTPLGQRDGDLFQFDPGVFIDDDGTIYLYSGNGPARLGIPCAHQGSQVMTLMPDMITLKTTPRRLLPLLPESFGTDFEGHAFYEASSLRKINGIYYLVYSSVNSHELCYATSDRPDGGFRFGGTLVDNADVYLNGRTEERALNPMGNTHGGMECIDGQWYIFYHRHSNRTPYCRQGCAEKLEILPDGTIRQAEVTSCGLNKGALAGVGEYPAYICCRLTGIHGAVVSRPEVMTPQYPYLTQDVPDVSPLEMIIDEPVQYVANITNGSVVGYKYFNIETLAGIRVTLRGKADGKFLIKTDADAEALGEIAVSLDTPDWTHLMCNVHIDAGVQPLYFCYEGMGTLDFKSFELMKSCFAR